MDAISKDDRNSAMEAFTVFKRLTTISPDLIETDADRLIEKVDELLKRVYKAAGTSEAAVGNLPQFHELDLYRRGGAEIN